MSSTLEKPRTATVTIKLDASYRDRLKSLAITKKRTSHYLMKEAIERYLKVEEAQQAILQSVDDSVAHFEATGLHITHEEVKAWAEALKTNRHAQLPACHL
ncbi:MAG: ribbon-helix-helix protein, CopG family [Gallionella sp.]